MIIRLYPENNALPIGPAVNRVGSALPLRIVGVPSGTTGVAVSVFNADGAACNLAATRRGGEWVATVPASHFASWGKVARGLQVAVSYKDETDTTQTVVFVGDVRIEKTAAGDPEGTGRRSVPVTDVDEVEDGSSMKDIRLKVNELARIISGTVTALVIMALPLSAATPLEDIPGTNEVYTAAETDLAISNAIAHIPPPAAGGISTNDVCNIVTNEVAYGEWTFNPIYWDEIVVPPFYSEVSGYWVMSIIGSDLFALGTPDATRLEWHYEDDFDGQVLTVSTRKARNALGLARLVDLPPLTNGVAVQMSELRSDITAAAQSATNYTDAAVKTEFDNRITPGMFELPSGELLTILALVKRDLSTLPYQIYTSYGVDGLLAAKANSADVTAVAQSATNYTDSAIADADTTYARFAVQAPTNVNQSVQYVNVAAETPSTLAVLLPQGTGTKDWIIYVNARTNVTISLPSATWWLADTSATNDIAPQTPTALYFSQAADGIYTLGRQEFTEVVLP